VTLAGSRVLVTRRREQSEDLVRAIRECGGDPVVIPLISTGPPPSWEACDGALARISAFDAAAFASVNAVEGFAGRAHERGVLPEALGRIPSAAVGEATAAALARHGMRGAVVPAQYSAASLALALGASLAGKRVLIPCGSLALDTLPRALTDAGAVVETVVVYATTRSAEADRAAIARGVRSGEFDVVTLASPSAARYFGELFGAPERAAVAARCRIAAIGETTAAAIRATGFPVDVVAAESTARGLVQSITERFGKA